MKKYLLAAALCLSLTFSCSLAAVYAGETGETESMKETSAQQTAKGVPAIQVGDTVEDFSVTLTDGSTFTFSEALKDHKAVFVNIWASYCSPCKAEFPVINTIANKYSEDIPVVSISSYPLDDNSAVAAFKEALNLDFNMAGYDPSVFESLSGITNIPTSFMISSDGVLCWKFVGGLTDVHLLDYIFKTFAESESPDSLVGFELPDSSPELFGIKPISEEELTAAIDADSSVITCRNDDSKDSFPFLTAEGGGLTASGAGHTGSDSKLLLDVKASAGDVLRLSVVNNVPVYSQYLQIISEDGTAASYLLDKPHKEIDYIFPSDSEDGIQHIAVVFSVANDSEVSDDEFCTISRIQLLTGEDAKAAASSDLAYPASLEGAQMKVEIPDDIDMIHIFADDQDITPMLGASYPYLSEEPLRIHISVGPDINPESILFMDSTSDYYVRLSDCETDETGFYADVDPGAIKKADHYYIELRTLDPLSGFFSNSVRLYPNPESIEGYCNKLSEMNPGMKVTWNTADSSDHAKEDAISEQTENEFAETESTEAESTEAESTEAESTEADNAAADDAEAESSQPAYDGYVFCVTDQNGDPVEGVMLLVCDDSTCTPFESDADGMVKFDKPEANFKTHILSAPDGYSFDAGLEIETPLRGVAATITIEKQ